jgi:hypothetical protein
VQSYQRLDQTDGPKASAKWPFNKNFVRVKYVNLSCKIATFENFESNSTREVQQCGVGWPGMRLGAVIQSWRVHHV